MPSESRGRLVFAFILLAVWPSGCAWAQELGMKKIDEIPASCKESKYGPGDWLRKTKHDGRNRRYVIHVPPGYSSARPTPVVLFFHGGGGNAMRVKNFQGWSDLADARGFIVVYPDGTGALRGALHTWNAGICCGWAMDHKIDDVGFTRRVLDELSHAFCIDPGRVYASGFSNGALMSYRVGCELSDRIAAIGPVAGSLGVQNCRLSRPVSLIHFHGTADEFEPYDGGKGKPFPGSRRTYVYPSVKQSVTRWASLIGASTQPVPGPTRDKAACSIYPGGRNGSEVVLWTLQGAGHTWPGGGRMAGQWMLGDTNKDVSATRLIWEFFEKHPRK